MRAAASRGENPGGSDDELAFYDALETNDSAAQVLADETLLMFARELGATVRKTSRRLDDPRHVRARSFACSRRKASRDAVNRQA